MLDAEPFVACTAPSGLHFIRNAQAAVFAGDVVGDLEILGRRHNKSANAEDRLGHERRDLAGRRRLDQLLDVVGTRHFAARVFELERTAVAIRCRCVDDARDLRWQGTPV